MPERPPSCSKACRARSPSASPPSSPIPTIGIGAGPDCDGQILVFHDLVNLSFSKSAKFVRQYGDAAALFRAAIEGYRDDVAQRAFPADAESYHLPKDELLALEERSPGKLAVVR